jgi:hypothetical protein
MDDLAGYSRVGQHQRQFFIHPQTSGEPVKVDDPVGDGGFGEQFNIRHVLPHFFHFLLWLNGLERLLIPSVDVSQQFYPAL